MKYLGPLATPMHEAYRCHKFSAQISMALSFSLSMCVWCGALKLYKFLPMDIAHAEIRTEFVRIRTQCRASKHWGEEFRSGIALTTLHRNENVPRSHSWHSIRIPHRTNIVCHLHTAYEG